jgi:hypothetical protein
MKAIAQALAWVSFFTGNRPHKALPSSALLEKRPVRRVGGAEGAAENRVPRCGEIPSLFESGDDKTNMALPSRRIWH